MKTKRILHDEFLKNDEVDFSKVEFRWRTVVVIVSGKCLEGSHHRFTGIWNL